MARVWRWSSGTGLEADLTVSTSIYTVTPVINFQRLQKPLGGGKIHEQGQCTIHRKRRRCSDLFLHGYAWVRAQNASGARLREPFARGFTAPTQPTYRGRGGTSDARWSAPWSRWLE